mmetsp:Transcript_94410/g.303553  ORF Transcript_94410/g.303553 Transcript_94410/m.303553 type:complete len:258 (-) Transcript_94410:24-797(-)
MRSEGLPVWRGQCDGADDERRQHSTGDGGRHCRRDALADIAELETEGSSCDEQSAAADHLQHTAVFGDARRISGSSEARQRQCRPTGCEWPPANGGLVVADASQHRCKRARSSGQLCNSPNVAECRHGEDGQQHGQQLGEAGDASRSRAIHGAAGAGNVVSGAGDIPVTTDGRGARLDYNACHSSSDYAPTGHYDLGQLAAPGVLDAARPDWCGGSRPVAAGAGLQTCARGCRHAEPGSGPVASGPSAQGMAMRGRA